MSINHDMPDHEYHALPSLSASGAKLLVQPGGPAKYREQQDNPPPPKPQFDFGSLVHKLILGAGSEIELIDAEDWRTKTAREQRDQAHADGKIPCLGGEHREAVRMRDAVREHFDAGPLLAAEGDSEVSLFATDPSTGVQLRARPDRMTWIGDRLVILDVKTCASAEQNEFERAAAKFGYHIQTVFYRRVARLLGLHDDPAFLFIAVEKTPPYLVNVFEYSPADIDEGVAQVGRAISTYKHCTNTGVWPGYPAGIRTIHLPAWAHQQPTVEDLLADAE